MSPCVRGYGSLSLASWHRTVQCEMKTPRPISDGKYGTPNTGRLLQLKKDRGTSRTEIGLTKVQY